MCVVSEQDKGVALTLRGVLHDAVISKRLLGYVR